MKISIPTKKESLSFTHFDLLSQDALLEIIPIVKKFELERNDHLVRIGQVCNYISTVREGVIRQYFYKGEKDITEYFALDGMPFFCVESFIRRTPSQVGAVAIEPSIVLAIPHNNLKDLCKRNPEIEFFYRGCLEESLIVSQHRMYSQMFETAYERYNNILHKFPQIIQRVPSIYIASYLGVSPETLSRMKSQKT